MKVFGYHSMTEGSSQLVLSIVAFFCIDYFQDPLKLSLSISKTSSGSQCSFLLCNFICRMKGVLVGLKDLRKT